MRYIQLVKNIVEPIREKPAVRNVLGLVSLYFFGTFLWSTFKTVRKLTSPKAKRRRKVNKNLTVIESLNEYFPNHRNSLTTAALDKIKYVTGFSYALIFRKYFRYMLNERKVSFEQNMQENTHTDRHTYKHTQCLPLSALY